MELWRARVVGAGLGCVGEELAAALVQALGGHGGMYYSSGAKLSTDNFLDGCDRGRSFSIFRYCKAGGAATSYRTC